MLRISAFTLALVCSFASTVAAEGGDAPAPGTAGAAPAAQPIMQPTSEPTTPPLAAPVAVPAPMPIVVEEEHPAPNSVFVEGLGAGLFYSVNYERLVLDQLGIRIGLSYMSYGATAGGTSANVSYFTVPLTAEYVGVRAGSHVLEIGAGGTLVFADGAASAGGLTATSAGVSAIGTAHIGYRIHPMRGGFQFRVGAAALYGPGLSLSSPNPASWGILPWFYLSAGASF